MEKKSDKDLRAEQLDAIIKNAEFLLNCDSILPEDVPFHDKEIYNINKALRFAKEVMIRRLHGAGVSITEISTTTGVLPEEVIPFLDSCLATDRLRDGHIEASGIDKFDTVLLNKKLYTVLNASGSGLGKLESNGIYLVRDLVHRSLYDLSRAQGVGEKTLESCVEFMIHNGAKLV